MKIRIFVASPTGLERERKKLRDLINLINHGFRDSGVEFELREWHDAFSDMGRPEEVILTQMPVDTWDIFIGILWDRFGTPTGGIDSKIGREFQAGTEEEFVLAYESWKSTGKPRILFFQCLRRISPELVDHVQFGRVKTFFANFSPSGKHPGLVKKYRTIEEFSKIAHTFLLRHLEDCRNKSNLKNDNRKNQIFQGKEYVYIPEGPFLMGSSPNRVNELKQLRDSRNFDHELFRHDITLPAYFISKHPVTNLEYKSFIEATGWNVPYRDDCFSHKYNWNTESRSYPQGMENHPVVLVSWYDAQAFCAWIGGRLPTEAEWEKAARGVDGREWPWGNTWFHKYCNSAELGPWEITPVGTFSPQGDSPFGVSDMAGNVWEWCMSLLRRYPYDINDGRDNPITSADRVLRGGAFDSDPLMVRCAYRNGKNPNDFGYSIGFRVVLPESSAK